MPAILTYNVPAVCVTQQKKKPQEVSVIKNQFISTVKAWKAIIMNDTKIL